MSLDQEIIISNESDITEIISCHTKEIDRLRKANLKSYLCEITHGSAAALCIGFIGNDLMNSGLGSLTDFTNIIIAAGAYFSTKQYFAQIKKVKDNYLSIKLLDGLVEELQKAPTYRVIGNPISQESTSYQ